MKIAVVNSTVPGVLQVNPGDISAPLVSSFNFGQNSTRANILVVALSSDGAARIAFQNHASSPIDVVLGVNGFFRQVQAEPSPGVSARISRAHKLGVQNVVRVRQES